MGKSADSIVLCNEPSILQQQQSKFTFTTLRSNILYEISDECIVEET